jgi:hypothetical protein
MFIASIPKQIEPRRGEINTLRRSGTVEERRFSAALREKEERALALASKAPLSKSLL